MSINRLVWKMLSTNDVVLCCSMTAGMSTFKISPLILKLIILIFDFTCDAVSLYSDVVRVTNIVCSKNLLFQTVLFQ